MNARQPISLEQLYADMRNDMRLLEDMRLNARTESAKARIDYRLDQLKRDSHDLLLSLHKERAAAAADAKRLQAEASAAAYRARAATMDVVLADLLPRRVVDWLQREHVARSLGREPRKGGLFAVLLGVTPS